MLNEGTQSIQANRILIAMNQVEYTVRRHSNVNLEAKHSVTLVKCETDRWLIVVKVVSF